MMVCPQASSMVVWRQVMSWTTPGHAADLDIVAGFDNAHKGHLHTADKVRQRVLKAERDGDAADAKSGDEGVCINAKTVVEDKAAGRSSR